MTLVFAPYAPVAEIEAALGDAAFAALHRSGAPVIVAWSETGEVLAANRAATDLFRADPLELSRVLFQNDGPAAARLSQLARILPPGAAPRLERIRLSVGGVGEAVTLLCRRVPAEGDRTLFLVAAPGMRASLYGRGAGKRLPSTGVFKGDEPEGGSEAMASDREPEAAVEPSSGSGPDDARLRFAWRADRDGVLLALAPLPTPLGASPSWAGRRLDAIAAEAGADAQGLIRAALEKQATFAGLSVPWPTGRGRKRVEFGAMPQRDAEGGFTGWRGYGVVHPEPVEDARGEDGDAPVLPTDPAPVEAAEPEPPQAITHPEPAAALNNVVPLRPLTRAEPTPALSPAERSAFDEIARALTAFEAVRRDAPEADEQGPPEAEQEPHSSVAADPPEDTASEGTVPQHPEAVSARHKACTDEDGVIARALSPFETIAEFTLGLAKGWTRGQDSQGEASPHRPDAHDASEPADPAPVPSADPVPPAPADGDEDSLSELSSDQARAMLDRVPVGLLVLRGDRPVFANRVLLDLVGSENVESLGEPGALERLFAQGGHVGGHVGGLATLDGEGDATLRLRLADGDAIPVDARAEPIDWANGSATLVSLRRATRSNEADLASLQAVLRERDAEARELHAVLDTATDGVLTLDGEGRILSFNRSAEALFGCERGDVLGQPLAAIVAEESREAVTSYFDRLKAGGVASVMNDGRDIFCRAPRGGAIPVFLTLGRIGSEGAARFCAVLRDLTAWKQAEHELNEARRQAEGASALKSDFLAKVSHEVRTPLNAIIGFAEVMMDERFGPLGSDRYKEYLRDIHRSGEHVMSLVNDLLDLSKIEAGRMEMSFTPVDANALVSECVGLLQPQASRERVVIRLALAPRLPSVMADERAFRQIVLNILSNAVKYNEPGGQVIVSTARTDAGHAVVRVRDTGLGMSEAELEAALEPFRQIATTRPVTGTGLGLPLTVALAEANKAQFTIRSRKNEGTLVEIAFPPSRMMAE